MDLLHKKNIKYTINCEDKNAVFSFHQCLKLCLKQLMPTDKQDLVVVCIGTDRCTGDSLGPLIGHKLHGNKYKKVHIYGTLENPVHAKNLHTYLEKINLLHTNPFIIGIDASLGKYDRVGYINIAQGPVLPGSGVNKNLPPVGDMHITGIVNISGFMEHIILQNTRLHMVMKMADIIYRGLHRYFLLNQPNHGDGSFDSFLSLKDSR